MILHSIDLSCGSDRWMEDCERMHVFRGRFRLLPICSVVYSQNTSPFHYSQTRHTSLLQRVQTLITDGNIELALDGTPPIPQHQKTLLADTLSTCVLMNDGEHVPHVAPAYRSQGTDTEQSHTHTHQLKHR